MSAKQLPLQWLLRRDATFNNYYAGTNAEVFSLLKKAATGKNSERCIYLYGRSGLGKSHLLQAVCHEMAQHKTIGVYLPLADIHSPDILNGLENYPVICLDDIHTVFLRSMVWEESLFYFYNRVLQQNGCLIFSAHVSPAQLPIQLADLRSRLAGSVIYGIKPLQEEEKIQGLLLCAKERGLELSEEVLKFLLIHHSRGMADLCLALEKLDRASLAYKKRLTLPFVKNILQL